MTRNGSPLLRASLAECYAERLAYLNLPSDTRLEGKIAVMRQGIEIVWRNLDMTPEEVLTRDFCVPGALRDFSDRHDIGLEVYSAHLTRSTGVDSDVLMPSALATIVQVVMAEPKVGREVPDLVG